MNIVISPLSIGREYVAGSGSPFSAPRKFDGEGDLRNFLVVFDRHEMIWGKGKQKLENSTPAAPKIILVCTNNKQSMFEMTIVHDFQMWRRRREANKRHNLQITTVMNFDLLKNYVRKRYRQTDRQIDGRTAAKTARLRPVNSKIKPRYTTNKQHSLHLLQISQSASQPASNNQQSNKNYRKPKPEHGTHTFSRLPQHLTA